ncbi:hypothetical protein ES705_21628 [subsurface metagenome]
MLYNNPARRDWLLFIRRTALSRRTDERVSPAVRFQSDLRLSERFLLLRLSSFLPDPKGF